MAIGPRTPVQAPPAEAPRIGLLASFPAETDAPRWSTGIAYMPEGCIEGELKEVCAPTENTPSDLPAVVEWDPYFVTVTAECSTFSSPTGEDTVDDSRARRALVADRERQLGLEFWEGGLAQASSLPNTWLSNDDDPNFVVLSPGSNSYVRALACLQEFLASNNGGQQGAIHATAQVVTRWESFRLLRRENNRILTMQDHVVVVSPGYTGTDPDGAIGSDNIWAYATDKPRVYLGDTVIAPIMDTIDRVNNTIQVTASQQALVEFQNCRHAGIQIADDPCSSY